MRLLVDRLLLNLYTIKIIFLWLKIYNNINNNVELYKLQFYSLETN